MSWDDGWDAGPWRASGKPFGKPWKLVTLPPKHSEPKGSLSSFEALQYMKKACTWALTAHDLPVQQLLACACVRVHACRRVGSWWLGWRSDAPIRHGLVLFVPAPPPHTGSTPAC
jgi:hypothetical protein